MGGKLTIMVRKKNGDKVSFKTHTGASIRLCFDDSHVLDEQKFFERLALEEFNTASANSFAEHVNFLKNPALFAPYHYGLLFIDHVEKKVFCCNNQNGFMEYTTKFIMHDLARCMGDTPISVEDLNAPVDPSEYFGDIDIRRLMRECNNYAPNLKFSLAGEDIGVSSFGDLLSKILSAKGISLDESDVREAVYKYYIASEAMDVDVIDPDVVITHKGWDIYVGDGRYEHVAKVYEHCKAHSILSELDETAWNDYFEDCRKYESNM